MEISGGKSGSVCRKTPMARSLHRLWLVNCWCSTIKGKTPTCSASIAATAGQSGRQTAHCFSTDGRLLCIGVTTGSTRLSCWEVTLSRTSVLWHNLADGAERWWVGGLPPCGKSTPVVGGGLLFFAAPDIILEPAAERKNPDRAEQFYANNAARVTAVRPGGKGEVSETNIAWSERKGVPGVPSPLYYDGRLYSFLNGGIVYCRVAKTGKLVYSGRLEVPGYYYSSPVAADHKVYIAFAEGVVVVLDAGEEV